MFQSVALSVLSCFSQDEEIMTHPSVLFNLPVILDIITNADDEAYEENLMIIKDAYICLNSVVAFDKGRLAFINNRGMQSLCVVITKQVSLNFPALFFQKVNEDNATLTLADISIRRCFRIVTEFVTE